MKLIIFDAYGTLISTGTGSLDAVKKILALQNQAINPESFYRDWKKQHRINMNHSNNHFFVNEEAIFNCDLRQLYLKYEIHRDSTKDVAIMLDTLGKRKCFEETLSSIKKLRHKYRIVIGSTSDTKPLLQDLNRNKLVVDEVYTSELIRKYKPDLEFYHFILEKENCNKEDAVFIGDSYVDDVYGPSLAGIKSILIDRKNTFCCEQNKVQPWKIASSLENIIELIDEPI